MQVKQLTASCKERVPYFVASTVNQKFDPSRKQWSFDKDHNLKQSEKLNHPAVILKGSYLAIVLIT